MLTLSRRPATSNRQPQSSSKPQKLWTWRTSSVFIQIRNFFSLSLLFFHDWLKELIKIRIGPNVNPIKTTSNRLVKHQSANQEAAAFSTPPALLQRSLALSSWSLLLALHLCTRSGALPLVILTCSLLLHLSTSSYTPHTREKKERREEERELPSSLQRVTPLPQLPCKLRSQCLFPMFPPWAPP